MALLTQSWCWDAVSIIVSAIIIAIVYVKRTYSYWKRRCVCTPKIRFPLGNANKIFLQVESFGENLQQVYTSFKPKGLRYCGYYITLTPVLVVLDLDLLKDIMTKDFIHFTDHGMYTNEKSDPLSGQLFLQIGTKWKNIRAKLTPTFTTGKMKLMFPILLDCSRELTNLMDKAAIQNQMVDILDIVGRYTTDVIGSCAFGIDCNSLKDPNSEFRHYGKLFFEKSIRQAIVNFLALSFPSVLETFKIRLFPKVINDFFVKMVTETVTFREKNNIFKKDFMHLLIQLKNNVKLEEESTDYVTDEQYSAGKTLTIQEMTAQAYQFFVAGFETSSTTLTFCFYELAINTKIQDLIRQEVAMVYEKYNGNITYESLNEMTYMENCINETLRKYPPLPFLMRQCTEEYKVPDSNLVIEKGTMVFIPILGIHHDAEYYPDPEKFDPDRFTPERKAERHPFSWIPFGEGPRACIGLRFGMMQTKVALTILLKNYKFSLNEKTVTPLVMDPQNVIMASQNTIWLNVEKIA